MMNILEGGRRPGVGGGGGDLSRGAVEDAGRMPSVSFLDCVLASAGSPKGSVSASKTNTAV